MYCKDKSFFNQLRETFRKYESIYFELKQLTTKDIIVKTECNKPCNFRQFRRVGSPTRIFQYEKNNKGLKLWVVSRRLVSEVRTHIDYRLMNVIFSRCSFTNLLP